MPSCQPIDLERSAMRRIMAAMQAVEGINRPGGAGLLKDSYGRAIRDLRVSLTDRCNFRCCYCLPDRAEGLKAAGLDRITISLDSLKRDVFKQMTGVDVLDQVLAGITAAKNAGLQPIKINAVIVRGHNEDEVADFAAFAREHDLKMRFIEFMPLDSGHEWARDDVVSGREIRERISERFPLTPVAVLRGSETSSRYRFADGAPGEIGIIAPVTEAFCGACSRIRLTADGQIRTCLFSTVEHSLRDVVRDGASRAEIIDFVRSVVMKKEPRHYINEPSFVAPSRSMSFIGG